MPLLSWRCHWCWMRTGWKNLLTRQERSSPCRIVSEFRPQWDVIFDRWSIHQNIRSHRRAFRATTLLACFQGLSIVNNISNSLTSTVASWCVCTSPLAVMTIVELHDFVKVSISASFKSCLLIICIDALESKTNSRSSSSRVDAGKHLFSEGEKNAALFFLLSL